MARGLNQAGASGQTAEQKRTRSMNYAHLIKEMKKSNNKNDNARDWMSRPAYCYGDKRKEWEEERERRRLEADTSEYQRLLEECEALFGRTQSE